MNSTEFLIIVAVYLIVSAVVAFIADKRGHGFETPFLVSVYTTPLIAAILFAPYAQNTPSKKTAASAPLLIKEVPETSWTIAQVKLKESYERGEISVEEYQRRWNE